MMSADENYDMIYVVIGVFAIGVRTLVWPLVWYVQSQARKSDEYWTNIGQHVIHHFEIGLDWQCGSQIKHNKRLDVCNHFVLPRVCSKNVTGRGWNRCMD